MPAADPTSAPNPTSEPARRTRARCTIRRCTDAVVDPFGPAPLRPLGWLGDDGFGAARLRPPAVDVQPRHRPPRISDRIPARVHAPLCGPDLDIGLLEQVGPRRAGSPSALKPAAKWSACSPARIARTPSCRAHPLIHRRAPARCRRVSRRSSEARTPSGSSPPGRSSNSTPGSRRRTGRPSGRHTPRGRRQAACGRSEQSPRPRSSGRRRRVRRRGPRPARPPGSAGSPPRLSRRTRGSPTPRRSARSRRRRSARRR